MFGPTGLNYNSEIYMVQVNIFVKEYVMLLPGNKKWAAIFSKSRTLANR